MKKIFFIGLILMVFMSCENEQKRAEKEKEIKKELLEQEYESSIIDLNNRFNISALLDTLTYKYSIQYEELFKSGYQLSSRFKIQDIYIKDTMTFVSIEAYAFPTLYLDFPISKNQTQKLLSLDRNLFIENGILVIRLTEIKKINVALDCIADERYFYVEFDDPYAFLGKGEIIEMIILNQ